MSAQHQSLTSEQADATEQNEGRIKTKKEPKADEFIKNEQPTRSEQMRLDRERQKAVKAKVAHQQKVEKEKKDAELAVFAERKRLANLAKQEERERQAKLAAKGLAPQGKSTTQLAKEESKKTAEQATGTTSGMDKQPFVFNTNAPEFTPKSKIVTLPSAMEEQDSDEYESTNGDDLGDEQEYVGGNLSVPPLYGQAYYPNYAAWLAQQQAW